jgi:hypothetical protein
MGRRFYITEKTRTRSQRGMNAVWPVDFGALLEFSPFSSQLNRVNGSSPDNPSQNPRQTRHPIHVHDRQRMVYAPCIIELVMITR